MKLILNQESKYGNFDLAYDKTHELFGNFFRLKSKQQKVRLFIGENEYWAEEARFGGTVYQKVEAY